MTNEEILKRCNAITKNTLMETLSIEYTEIGKNYLAAKMPVNSKVYQPDGVLHGGAMVALAESVGSAAAIVFLDPTKFSIRGIEISANHVRSIKSGYVFAKAMSIHLGKTTQVWDIKITDKDNRLISAVKLTTLALPKSS
ncbi:PaaI family thioesterase [Mesohalobacter halotolerans]|uniref:PaaI family thioesterase n=1 Tax=Mesohalobacter halotolerans TaxID=1883405 RepID=A0A4U5TNW0_9FLAO|nr:PaaI family thioesterase [Mesohalobacter halotolerans]MBS3737535.1 PaaI family thioesterase [Psychroflexus sp.]TKS55727.1 PaaI family thioesterase [Mesohalobacter halotolerans]